MAMLVRPQIEILSDTENFLSERVVELTTAVNPSPPWASRGPRGALGGGAETLKIRRSLGLSKRTQRVIHFW